MNSPVRESEMQNSEFTVLDASREADRNQWLDLWNDWPDREVFAHPGWVDLFRGEEDHSICVVLKSDGGCILFPLIARPIDQEPWGKGFDCIDLASPYGYGGPFRWGNVDESVFWAEFQIWAKAKNVVSCFARLSLFRDHAVSPPGSEKFNAANVIRYLELAPDELWMDYAHKVRKNVKRAQREGVRVEIDFSGSRIEEFLAIYYATMDRRGASQAYYFNRSFFARLIGALKGQFVFFHALHRGALVSTELVLSSATHIYSFLGGTLDQLFDLRPNDMIKHEIILWGCHEKKQAYVLGGGYGAEDGILRYKRSFAPKGDVSFNTLQLIIDHELYDRLIATRASFEARHSTDWPRHNFFPAYRA
jgi:CelD/BcsL family acetyltransferase involved in cellulose biosynthesis